MMEILWMEMVAQANALVFTFDFMLKFDKHCSEFSHLSH